LSSLVISATTIFATRAFGPGGRRRVRSFSTKAAAMRPDASEAGPLATTRSRPLRASLPRACAVSRRVSRANPTKTWPGRRLAAASLMISGLGIKVKRSGAPFRLILCPAVRSTRQSETAAAPIMTVAARTRRKVSFLISSAVTTSTTWMPRGGSRSVGPLVTVTFAPASLAAAANAKPIAPLEALVRKRTGSRYSRVGPDVMRTVRPRRLT